MPVRPHTVQLYQDDVFLIQSVSAFIKSGIEEGATVIVVTTEKHGKDLQRSLDSSPALLRETNVRFFDAATTLSSFMKDEWPSKHLFLREVGYIIQQAAPTGPVRVFEEMVAVLCAQDNVRAAIRLEELWNQLAIDQTFALLCAYPNSVFSDEIGRAHV